MRETPAAHRDGVLQKADQHIREPKIRPLPPKSRVQPQVAEPLMKHSRLPCCVTSMIHCHDVKYDLTESKEFVDFDDVLPYVGEFGTYHWLLFFGLAPASFNLALIYFVQFFITLTPDYWCAVEALQDAGLGAEER
ncbi:Carcinine transporter [Portunus trituberculatus]|uniref:Carcinine transporter n=1 Tax=Portunus trituberculatus TaxID=210409 RepID=A0A5B7FNA6_PORTR|nr:Carcinine transporter [Portunus trituberculatus]